MAAAGPHAAEESLQVSARLLLTLATGGLLALVYLVLLLVLPVVPDEAEYERRRERPSEST